MAEEAASVGDLSPAFAPGRVLAGKYRVERVLGEGGMGVVLAARHLELGHRVAVKVLAPGAVLKSGAVERFLREGRAAARLTSPHAARVYDVGRLPEGGPFLVMELVSGRDLESVLAAEGPQPWARVVRWCREVADALVEAHRGGVIHRDIKPGNLMLADVVGARPIVKVLDFGISKLIEDGSDPLTRTSVVMGSPRYMAPEQLISSEHVSPKIDIWALGIVLFELSTGRAPFDGGTIAQLVLQIQSVMPPPPSLLVKGIPSSFDAVVLRCLAKNPDARFESMATLRAALAELEASAGPQGTVRPSELSAIVAGAPHPGDETVSAARVSPAQLVVANQLRARNRRWVLQGGIAAASAVIVAGLFYLLTAQRGGGHAPAVDVPAASPSLSTTDVAPAPSASPEGSGSASVPEPSLLPSTPSVRVEAPPPSRPSRSSRPVTTGGGKPRRSPAPAPAPAPSETVPSKPSMD